MDTLELGWYSADVRSTLLQKAKELGIPTEIQSRAKRNLMSMGYRKSHIFTINEKTGAILWDQIHPNNPTVKLQLHASQFRNWNSMKHVILALLDGNLAAAETGRITRLDLCVDLAVPFYTLWTTLRHKGAGSYLDFGKQCKEVVFGKFPFQTVVYEKLVSLSEIDNQPVGSWIPDAQGLIEASRIEVRLKRAKIPILMQGIGDIEKLQALQPFNHLVLNELDPTIVENLSKKNMIKVDAYRYQREKLGAEIAHRNFNDGHNFHRDIGRFLRKMDIDLQECWQTRVKRFLGDQSELRAI